MWGCQETTLAAALSGARAMPPGGYFYTLQCWEQAVCSQNRYELPASHTECNPGCTGKQGMQQGRERETGGRGLGWGLGSAVPGRPHPAAQPLTFFFSLEEGSLPEQRPDSTPPAPFTRVEDLARLLSTSSSSNFFLLMNLWKVLHGYLLVPHVRGFHRAHSPWELTFQQCLAKWTWKRQVLVL